MVPRNKYAAGSPAGLRCTHSMRVPSIRPKSDKRCRMAPERCKFLICAACPGRICAREKECMVINRPFYLRLGRDSFRSLSFYAGRFLWCLSESARGMAQKRMPYGILFAIFFYCTAALRSSTRSVFSQATPSSSRPIWPYAASGR